MPSVSLSPKWRQRVQWHHNQISIGFQVEQGVHAGVIYRQQQLDQGRVAGINALAAAEGGDRVRVCKMLKLARLAPEIAEDIARCRQPVGLSLEFFPRNPLPDDWDEQRRLIAAWAN